MYFGCPLPHQTFAICSFSGTAKSQRLRARNTHRVASWTRSNVCPEFGFSDLSLLAVDVTASARGGDLTSLHPSMAASSASKRARPTPAPAPAPEPAPVAVSIRLTVSDIAGEVRVIEVDENETVAHVKTVLEVEFAVPLTQQLLFFETKKLENHERLRAAGVKNDDMLMMQVVRAAPMPLGGIGGLDSMRLNADPSMSPHKNRLKKWCACRTSMQTSTRLNSSVSHTV